jgi:hypothetical protein
MNECRNAYNCKHAQGYLGLHFKITVFIIILNRYVLRPFTSVSLDLEDALGLSIFVLVLPDHDVHSDNAERPDVGEHFFHSCHRFPQFPLVYDNVFTYVG